MSEIFNSRELAVLCWLLILLAVLGLRKNSTNLFRSCWPVIKSLFAARLTALMFVAAILTFIAASTLKMIDFWRPESFKQVIVWYCAFLIPTCFKVQQIRQGKLTYKSLMTQSFSLAAIIEFISGLKPFSFWLEIFIIPVLWITAAMSALNESRDDEVQQKQSIDKLVFFIFGIFISASIWNIVRSSADIAITEVMAQYFTPIILTVIAFPFIAILVLLTKIEDLNIRLRFANVPEKLRLYAIAHGIFYFGFGNDSWARWEQHLGLQKITSKKDIQNSVALIKRIFYNENKPQWIHPDSGWRPIEAIGFMSGDGISLDYYRPEPFSKEESWYSSSQLIELPENKFKVANNFTFAIYGTEHRVKKLQLNLNINNYDDEQESIERIAELFKHLSVRSVGKVSSQILSAVSDKREHSQTLNKCNIELKINKWPTNGYTMRLSISKS